MPEWGLIQGSVFVCAVALATVVSWMVARRLAGGRGVAWGVIGAMVVIAAAGVWWAERRAGQERVSLRRQIQGLPPTLAFEMEGHGHESIDVGTAPDDPAYLDLIARQRRLLAINRGVVADIYTFRVNDRGEPYLVVDSETDYDGNGRIEGEREGRTAIGEVFGEETEPERRALAGETAFDDEVYTDRWGTWVSAYAPIRGPNGAVEAVLGVDFPASRWVARISTARWEAYTLAGIVALVVVASGVVARVRQSALVRLRESAERAEEGVRAKSQFLANISHEIRTPMTAIMGYADLLLDPSLAEADRLVAMSTIKRAGEHLLCIVNDLLDLSKLEAERLHVERILVSPVVIVAEVESLMRPRAEGKGIVLTTEFVGPIPRTIESDPLRFRQILLNLVGNAIKFTECGSVRVIGRMATAVVDRAPLFVVDVVDTGIGMTESQMGRLFRAFSQADPSTTREYGGTGLGLMISKRLAWLLGGDIEAESRIGSGSTFTAMVSAGSLEGVAFAPVAPGSRGAGRFALPSEVVESTALRGRILLAEDGPDNQRLISFHLRRAGADVEIVGSGREAVDRVLGGSGPGFDVILMDMQMPEMDGYEATSELRRAGCDVPIVALTANAMAEDRARCLRAGCDDFASKPIDARSLIDLCSRHMVLGRNAAA